MGHILLLYQQEGQRIRDSGLFSSGSGHQILYYDPNHHDLPQPSTDSIKCLMIGIPIEMPQDEYASFLEPYLADIVNILLFQDLNLEGCQSAVIQFVEQDPMESFCRLYSNLHFPSHSTSAPCIVFPLQECILSLETSQHFSSNTLTTLSESDRIFPSHHLPSSPPDIISLPSVEREISSESHQSNELSRDNDRLNWSLLSPPPPNYLQLPNCPICLRRLINRVSHLNEGTADERDKLIIGPAFIGHGDRCRVCHIYSDTSSLLRICNVCGLRENLWTCLQCGYTGCGRYTSQHAKKHFHHKGHPFSLELATGRIWDYVHDTFVHIDPLCEFSPQSLSTSSAVNPFPYTDPSLEKPYSVYPLSASTNMLLPTSAPSEEITKSSPINEDQKKAIVFHSSVSETANEKMRHLQQDYEDLLVSQLTDQRLYYEKLLAQNTVQILESGHHIPSVDRFLMDSEYLFDSSPQSKQWAEHADQELATIENLKLDISGLEYDYSLTLQKIRGAEMKALELRKFNEKLVANQKIQRQRISDFTERAEELKKREEEKIESLEQEIKDLEFFIRARNQINSSDLREEVKSGVMIVQQGRVPKSSRKKKGGR